MIEVRNEPLTIDFGSTFQVVRLQPTGDARILERREITFELNQRDSVLGRQKIRQWWLPIPGLYGDQGKMSPNHHSVLDCFWGWCQDANTAFTERDVKESFVLANLLPRHRSKGSRTVFLDSKLRGRSGTTKTKGRDIHLDDLNAMLQAVTQDRLESVHFIERTAKILGPPEFDGEVWSKYRQMSDELLDEACNSIETRDFGGIGAANEKWEQNRKSFSSRSGKKLEKKVLDILSYECRAAFHRAYSAAWIVILEALKQRFNLTPQEEAFHRFWHVDLVAGDSVFSGGYSHLFHGHIFALHPACANFISTDVGAAMVGDFLETLSLHHYKRVLAGILVAVIHYAERHDEANLVRRSPVSGARDLKGSAE
jgi:hypothetical protein